jgi:hypothetical protein
LKQPTARVGWIVAVTLLDHVEDGSEPLLFTVYGRVSKVTRDYLCVDCWEYTGRRKHDRNCKRYTIVRSAIQGITQLIAK